MNKLMIAAASAVMIGGAYADCAGCKNPEVTPVVPVIDVPEVYTSTIPGHIWDVKMSLKTIGPKTMKCKGDCADDQIKYFDNVTRTINGVAWTCYEPCTDENDDQYQKDHVLLWDAKNKVSFGTVDYATHETDATVEAGAFRYGKKAEKAAYMLVYEGAGVTKDGLDQEISLNAVGLGTIKTYKASKKGNVIYDPYTVINKISGGVVGTITSCPCEDTPLILAICEPDFEGWCEGYGEELDGNIAPFYGTFTVKYNTSKSSALRTTSGYLMQSGKVFPKYAITVAE